MSVLDRVRKTKTGTNRDTGLPSTGMSSTHLANPVAQRLSLVATELVSYINAKGDTPYNRYVWVVQCMIEEIFGEIDDLSQDTLAEWMEQFGKVLTWCGSGDDTILPESVREYLRVNHEDMLTVEPLAIEA